MPLKKYDRFFGGAGGASKAHAAMVKEYGAKKGEKVFYATKNKKKGKGKNPLFGNSLPFEYKRTGGWFKGTR